MADGPRMTTSVLKVVSAMLADLGADHYGLALMQATGLPSGTMYPILIRLERAGWVESRWEDIDPAAQGRPGRRYYRLTASGAADGRREIATVHAQLSRAAGPVGEVRTT